MRPLPPLAPYARESFAVGMIVTIDSSLCSRSDLLFTKLIARWSCCWRMLPRFVALVQTARQALSMPDWCCSAKSCC